MSQEWRGERDSTPDDVDSELKMSGGCVLDPDEEEERIAMENSVANGGGVVTSPLFEIEWLRCEVMEAVLHE